MDLKDLPSNSKTFIDTNIFLYAISDHPRYGTKCNNFLDRIKLAEIRGVISVIVLNELIHKMIIAEIAQKKDLKSIQVIRYIKNNPQILKELESYEIIKDVETSYNLEIVDVKKEDFLQAQSLMPRYFLLSNDALHLAIMEREGINKIATNDPDFDRVKDITVWKP